MSDWTTLVIFLGRFLLAFYFLKAGISNAYNWKKISGLLKTKKIPLSNLVVAGVVLIQILASVAIIVNFYVLIASTSLIIFTLAANFLICNYWKMEGLERRNISFVFYANFAVIGALLLITGMSPRG